MIEETTAADGAPEGYVELASAGERVSGEFRCSECGYGVTVLMSLPACPMCGGTVWEEAVRIRDVGGDLL